MAGESPASTWSLYLYLLTLFFSMPRRRISGLFLTVILLAGCAQMGPPVPPSLELPKVVNDLKVVRKGDKAYLRWTVPTQTTDGQRVDKLGATRICRSFDEKATQCERVGSAAAASSGGKSTGPANEGSYVDTLPPDLQQDPAKILS